MPFPVERRHASSYQGMSLGQRKPASPSPHHKTRSDQVRFVLAHLSLIHILKDAGLFVDDARIVEYVRLSKVWFGFDPDALPTPGVVVRCV